MDPGTGHMVCHPTAVTTGFYNVHQISPSDLRMRFKMNKRAHVSVSPR